MADGHLVRVTGGWLKWDKDHYKWENVEESAASKNHVLKRAKSCVGIPATPELSPLLKKRAKPLKPPKNAMNKIISKKPPMVKNKIPKHHSLMCLGSRAASNKKVNISSQSPAPQSAASSSYLRNKSCDTTGPSSDDPKSTTETGQSEVPGQVPHQTGQRECPLSSEKPSSSCDPTNRSVTPMEERMSQDHSAMMAILSSRLLRLQAAATLWSQCGSGALVSYLLKVNDDGVTADILPILVNSLTSQEKCPNVLSVEICFDLRPLINQLLHSKYEDYIVKVLSFLDTVLHCWDDRQQGGHQLTSCLQEFVRDIRESVQCLFQQDNSICDKAKKFDNYMKQLILKHSLDLSIYPDNGWLFNKPCGADK